MNNCVFVGRLASDPECRSTSTGIPVCRFRLAVNRRLKEKGERKTDFFSVVVWRQQAEFAAKYLRKGMQVAVHGELHVESYTDQQNRQRYYIEVSADDMRCLEPKTAEPGPQNTAEPSVDLPDPLNDEGFPF
ncbi:MAG: single-stranded DNA-binding protein [Clostridia bacterium]|nr:single-stranded DNA-binding protein [Clostridia bacterium]